jgi:hypothetical protein
MELLTYMDCDGYINVCDISTPEKKLKIYSQAAKKYAEYMIGPIRELKNPEITIEEADKLPEPLKIAAYKMIREYERYLEKAEEYTKTINETDQFVKNNNLDGLMELLEEDDRFGDFGGGNVRDIKNILSDDFGEGWWG